MGKNKSVKKKTRKPTSINNSAPPQEQISQHAPDAKYTAYFINQGQLVPVNMDTTALICASSTEMNSLGVRLGQTINAATDELEKHETKSHTYIAEQVKAFIDKAKESYEDKTQPFLFSEKDFQISLFAYLKQFLINLDKIDRKNLSDPDQASYAGSLLLGQCIVTLVDYLEENCKVNSNGQTKNIIEYFIENDLSIIVSWLSVAYNYARQGDFANAHAYLEKYLALFIKYNAPNLPSYEARINNLIKVCLMIIGQINDKHAFSELARFSEMIMTWLNKIAPQVPIADYNELLFAAIKGHLFSGNITKVAEYLAQYQQRIKTDYEFSNYYSAMALHALKTKNPAKINAYFTKAESYLASALNAGKPVGHTLRYTYENIFIEANNSGDYATALHYAKNILRLYKEAHRRLKKILSKKTSNLTNNANYHNEKIEYWKSIVIATKRKVLQEKVFYFKQAIQDNIASIELINRDNFTVIIKLNDADLLEKIAGFLAKNYVNYQCQDKLITINDFYDFDIDKFARFCRIYNSCSKQSDVPKDTTTNDVNLNNDIEPSKCIKFDEYHIYNKNGNNSNVFKLHGNTTRRQYVCIKPELLAQISTSKGVDAAKIIKGLLRSCERGLVVNNSKGRKAFVIEKNDCKLRDPSKKIRFFGTVIKKVTDQNQKEHTLHGLDILDLEHKLNFETADIQRSKKLLK
jgi:hypothetical protein